MLTKSFKNLIENLWPSVYDYIDNHNNHRNGSNNYYAPYEFKEKISNMNPLFKGVQANDSKDLVNFIIMTLHEELNKADKKRVLNNNNQFINQLNKEVVLQTFLSNFANENKSIISDIFYGISYTSTQCLNCAGIKYNFQNDFFLIFHLEKVRARKIELLTNQFQLMNQNLININPVLYQFNFINFQNNLKNLNSVNIYDCFDFKQKVDYFTGENSMHCNICKNRFPSSFMNIMYSGPKILVIILNRGKGIEFNIKLNYSEDLDLINYIELKQSGCKYKLLGVVTPLEESGASSHFIAFCRSPIDNQWYRYKDDIVTKVNNFEKEIIDYSVPSILFFHKTEI